MPPGFPDQRPVVLSLAERPGSRRSLYGGDQVVTSSITKDAAVDDLGLEAGQPATVLIKSTEVTISVE